MFDKVVLCRLSAVLIIDLKGKLSGSEFGYILIN